MKQAKVKAWVLTLMLSVGMLSGCASGSGSSSAAPAASSGSSSAPASSSQAASSSSASSKAPSNEKVTLRINWWGGQDRADITQKVIDLYTSKHPNVTMNAEFTSFDGYWEKMSAMSAANNLPDILQHDLRYLKGYVDKGLLLDLTSYIGKGFDTTDIPDTILKSGYFNDKFYAISLGSNVWCVVYDPELFKKAGVAEPTNDWTWDDYENICMTIKQKLNIYGDGEFAGSGYNGWNYAFRQYGQSLYSADGSSLGFTDDSILQRLFTLDNKLYKAGAIAPPSVRIEIQEAQSEFIVTSRAAMASQQWSNGFVGMCSAAGRQLKLVLPPKAKDQKQWGGYIKPSQFFAVAAKTKAPDTAVDFINYFTNDVDANLILKGERGVPVNKKVNKALAEKLTDNDRLVFDFVSKAADYSSALPPATPTIHGEVENLMSTISFKVEEGSLTPDKVASYFRSQVEQLYKNKK